jgi:RNA polymerase sigma-70 factor (ECF subfamily)
MASGDREAATSFIRRYQARVFGLALAILSDRSAAEEVAQETFLKAYKHGGGFDPRRGQVSSWLLTITRNLAIDVLRMRRSDPFDPDTLMSLLESGSGDEADEPLLAADTSQRLRAALAELPRDQAVAVVHAGFLGRTAREISELEGVPIGTVKTRIRSALLKLRGALEADR